MSRILIVKLGALGDFFMALPAMQAIRAHHREDRLALLTIPALGGLAEASGLFDQIQCDPRAPWPLGHWRLARQLRTGDYARVYDLQGNRRTAWIFRFMWPRQPEWAGPVAGCALPRPPRPPGAHRTQWYAAQLAALGIRMSTVDEPAWLAGDLAALAMPSRYALLVAGGSAHRPAKRWPAAAYATVARALLAENITPLLLGTATDADINRDIAAAAPGVRDLTGRTSIAQIASLARGARGALGNDTGPMHVIAATGCACLVLYSAASDPAFVAPLGPRVRCLQRPSLIGLDVQTVTAALAKAWPA
jgi:ADP-heptose:LPS heptosyltransferase